MYPCRLTENDQFTLQLVNIELLSYIHLACLSRPGISFKEQISIMAYGCSQLNSIPELSGNFQPLNCLEIVKNSVKSCNRRSLELIQELSNLNLDNSTTILIQIICLFLVPSRKIDNPKKIKRLQNHYRLLMYRYLVRKHGKNIAFQTMNSIERIINRLVCQLEIQGVFWNHFIFVVIHSFSAL